MFVRDDKIIAERIRQGDKEIFSILFKTYYADLVSFANTFLSNNENSKEVVQQVFVEIWLSREQLNIEKSLKSYLLKSVQNKCFDHLRHSRVKNSYNEIVLRNGELFENNIEEYVFRSEIETRLSEAMIKMPADISEAFKMSRIYNLKYHEIADRLGVSQRTVEVRISKALKFLKDYLADYI